MNAELEKVLSCAAMNHGPGAREAVFGLHAAGLVETSIAEKLGVGIMEIQDATHQARLARPSIERRENRVTWELNRALLMKLEADPEPVIKCGLQNLTRMRQEHLAPFARGWVERTADRRPG